MLMGCDERADTTDVTQGSFRRASGRFANAAANVIFWLTAILAVGSFIGGAIALVRLNFVGVLSGFVMGGFWCLLAYMSRQGRAPRDAESDQP
jgi:hypothetical protein